MESHRSPSTSTRTGNVLVVTLFLILFLNPCLTAQPYLNQVGNQEATYLTSTKRNDLMSFTPHVGLSVSTDGGNAWTLYSLGNNIISASSAFSSDFVIVGLRFAAWGFPTRYYAVIKHGPDQSFVSVFDTADAITDVAIHESGKVAIATISANLITRIHYSGDFGLSWQSFSPGSGTGLRFYECNADYLFYRHGNDIYRYAYGDAAAIPWYQLYPSITETQWLDQNTLFGVNPSNNTLVYTSDRGLSWRLKQSDFSGTILSQVFKDGKLYRSNQQGIYVSADTGSTWSLIARGTDPGSLQPIGNTIFALSKILDKQYVTSPDPNYIPPSYQLPKKLIMRTGSKFVYSHSGNDSPVNSPLEWYSIDRDTVAPQNGKRYLIAESGGVFPTEDFSIDKVFNLPFRYDTVANKLYVLENGGDRLAMDFSSNSTIYSFTRTAYPGVMCSVNVAFDSAMGKEVIGYQSHFEAPNGVYTGYRNIYYTDTLGIYYHQHVISNPNGTSFGVYTRTLEMALINLGDRTVYYSAHHKPMFMIEPKQNLSVFRYPQYFQLTHHYNTNPSNVGTLLFIDTIKVEHYYNKNQDSVGLQNLYLPPHLNKSYHYEMNLDSSLFSQGYTYYYRITATDKSLIPEVTTVPETGFFAVNYDPAASVDDGEVPQAFELEQNYPNPFNPSTTISYTIPQSGRVSLKVYSVLGSEVATLHDGYQSAGTYSVQFNAADLPSGVYFYRLEAGDQSSTRKLLLLK